MNDSLFLIHKVCYGEVGLVSTWAKCLNHMENPIRVVCRACIKGELTSISILMNCFTHGNSAYHSARIFHVILSLDSYFSRRNIANTMHKYSTQKKHSFRFNWFTYDFFIQLGCSKCENLLTDFVMYRKWFYSPFLKSFLVSQGTKLQSTVLLYSNYIPIFKFFLSLKHIICFKNIFSNL